jgi:hypothetical protein
LQFAVAVQVHFLGYNKQKHNTASGLIATKNDNNSNCKLQQRQQHQRPGCDASPQPGGDYFLIEEHCVSIDDVVNDYKMEIKSSCSAPDCHEHEGPMWSQDARLLPPIILGSGHTNLYDKLVALLWAIRLEAGYGVSGENITQYCEAVVGIVTDLGNYLNCR